MKKAIHPKPTKELQSVWFEGHEIRSFLDDSQDCWLVARDVFKALGMTWHGKALKGISQKWVSREKFLMAQGKRMVSSTPVFINEAAFHIIAIRSNHPRAEVFIETVGQFIKDCRLGRVTQIQFNALQNEAQLLFGFFPLSLRKGPATIP